jgi:plasmid stabilization system protein ParE
MYRAEWTPLAERDLEEIAFFIGVQDHRPATAAKIVREIKAKCETYAHAPDMGTAAPELGENCSYFTHKRWVIIYIPTDFWFIRMKGALG